MKVDIQNICTEELEKLLKSSRTYDFFAKYYDDEGYCRQEIIELVKKDLYPLPVVDNENVVWGFHIIAAAAKLGIKNLLCRSLNSQALSKEFSKEEKLLITLQCENRKNNYSWEEKEKIYLFIVKELDGKVSDSVLSRIQHEGLFMNSVSLYNSFPAHLKNLIQKNIVDLKTAKNCTAINERAWEELEPYLLTLTFSNRRIFLTNLSELLKKNALDKEFDSSKSFSFVKKLLEKKNPLEAVFKARYPDFSSCTERFNQFNSEVLKDSGIKLKQPPYFEGNSYSVEFSFRSKKHLEKIINRLSVLKEKSDEIFRLL
ncbi:MAG: hypothetical protein FWC36_02580 [Spirochaetes bacterium]|nr:hypothetical protein [Spirochaetota bacterium]